MKLIKDKQVEVFANSSPKLIGTIAFLPLNNVCILDAKSEKYQDSSVKLQIDWCV
jgi:hypothetical protein